MQMFYRIFFTKFSVKFQGNRISNSSWKTKEKKEKKKKEKLQDFEIYSHPGFQEDSAE